MTSRAKKPTRWALEDYAIPEELVSRDGTPIRTADDTWIVELNVSLHWGGISELPEQIRLPIKSYICDALQRYSARTTKTIFWRLKLLERIGKDKLERLVREDIGINLFFAFKAALDNDPNVSQDSTKGHLSTFRRWYVWCSDAEIPGFNDEVALELGERTIGGGTKGKLVLSNDPDLGPLGFVDDTRIESAIARDCSDLEKLSPADLRALVVVMLSKSFGLYAAHLQLLDEADVESEMLSDGSEIHWIETPRLKKRGSRAQVGTRRRRLSTRLAEAIDLLKRWNSAGVVVDWPSEVASQRPLFFRANSREKYLNSPIAKDAHRWRLTDFLNATGRFCQRHALNFRITPRRLRYTFASRLVDEGCSPLELADALDHTDLQHVMVYFNSRGRIVRQLDEAMAARLAPIAMAFIGRPISGAHEASRAGDPASVIRFKASNTHDSGEIGSCGSFTHCGLNAPLACYTCMRFEPWLDSPHDVVLSELLRDRRRREEAGLDEKMIQIHDPTILAVSEVIRRCDASFRQESEDKK